MDVSLSRLRNPDVEVYHLLRLLRPINMAVIAAGTLVGGLLGGFVVSYSGASLIRLLLAAVSASLIGGAANSLNDVYDVATDRVNRPERPLAGGRVSLRQARMLWAAATALGIILAFLVSFVHVFIAVAAAAALFAYNAKVQRIPMAGNVVVSALVAATLLYGSLAVSVVSPAWIGAAFALLTTLAREIIKDIQDMRGDRAAGVRTLPLMIGTRPAAITASGILAATIFLAPLPYLYGGYGGGYLLLVLGASVLFFQAAWLLIRSARAADASRLTKGGMILGLLALAVAAL